MARIVILIPHGARTGGPESLFQLSDMLICSGFGAETWLISPEDGQLFLQMLRDGKTLFESGIEISPRDNPIAEYGHYRIRLFLGIAPSEDVVFVIPEIYLFWVPAFRGLRVVVWWLSVDNAFRSLSEINLNILRTKNMYHAVQSAYARAFVHALGLPRVTDLNDYTFASLPNVAMPLSARPRRVALNATPKVIINVEQLAEQITISTGAEVKLIRGVSQSQVHETFASSRIFVDLGHFPGRDRMAREAIHFGTLLIIARAGSGAYYDDYQIPDFCRVAFNETSTILGIVRQMLDAPDAFQSCFGAVRDYVSREKSLFREQVLTTFAFIYSRYS